MSEHAVFLVGAALTVAASLAVVWHLRNVLVDLTGTEARAAFRVAFTSLLLVVIPLIVAMFVPPGGRSRLLPDHRPAPVVTAGAGRHPAVLRPRHHRLRPVQAGGPTVNDADRVRLLHGPYAPPPLRKGDRAHCLLRDCTVVITSWTAARIPWPRCRALDGPGGGSGILLDEELAAPSVASPRRPSATGGASARGWCGAGGGRWASRAPATRGAGA
jgi:hypothetical protein